MTISVDMLKEFTQFGNLSDQEIQIITKIAKKQTFPKKKKIFKEETPAENLYLLNRGKVSIRMCRGLAGAEIEVDTVTSGEIFGWSAIVELEYTASAQAITDIETIMLPAEELCEIFEKNSNIGYQVMKVTTKVIARRLKLLWEQLVEKQQNLNFRTRGL
ncbi:hypothetical protein AKJ49_00145 [candidate division MSBL1 archaeon SCGC-AAA382A03]|uniref:Cyclic nucleotide-binding domain-containing protein n=1 Tax=candidate division MSBL1 archaeon SCGC-AAA382A03 TaxID=1698278 RepID=A0A133VH51_9EURY|nr:hypothetical protein AKJ49_00145 [candidate division MSBL1 archaeon SCGC-AAA382A03]